MLVLRAIARLSGATVLACMHKPVGETAQCEARLLSRQEIERASQDAALDLAPAFVASAANSQCYGVSVEGQVRCYAWTSVEPVRAVPGTVVRMPSTAAYVFKAFTDPLFRRRGLLRECLTAIERGASDRGCTEVTALVEVHNPSSIRAFRSAGFERCGHVFVLKRPWMVKRIGCRCTMPCTWSKDVERAAVSLAPAAEALARRS
jgi:L-amino acid N-acyltransferase YncA